MAWEVNGTDLTMTEGDFGIALPFTVQGIDLAAADNVKLVIKSPRGSALVEKTFTNIQQNTVSLILSAADSALLPVGRYVYYLDWYQGDAFLDNLVRCAEFKVVKKGER